MAKTTNCRHTNTMQICKKCREKLLDLDEFMVLKVHEADVRNLLTILRLFVNYHEKLLVLGSLKEKGEGLIKKLRKACPPTGGGRGTE